MKIAVVANTSWYIFNFRRGLMQALAALGHRLVIVGCEDGYTDRLKGLGHEVRTVPFHLEGTNPLQELGTVRRLRTALRDVEVVLSYTPKGTIYSALALSGTRTELIANISGLGRAFVEQNLLSNVAHLLYRATIRRAAWVFFQNEEDRAIFIERRFVAPERTSRIPGSGVDLSHFTPRPPPAAPAGAEKRVVFLLLARLLWAKGLREYATAARTIKEEFPHTTFRILGFLEKVESDAAVSAATVEGWQREGVIEYLGKADDVRPHLAAADCVVLPSYYREGVPRSLLEAAAMGRSVITTDTIGCRDTIVDGVSGFLCRPRSTIDLADAMRRFLSLTEAERAAMGAAGRARMEREFDETLVIAQYVEQLRRLARAR